MHTQKGEGAHAIVVKTPNLLKLADSRLQHSAVVKLFKDVDESPCVFKEALLHSLNPGFPTSIGIPDGKQAVLGMPCASGSLESMLRGAEKVGERLTASQGTHLLSFVFRHLSRLHAEGFVHMDLRPANVLLFTESRTARVADFDSSLCAAFQHSMDWDHGYLTVPERWPTGHAPPSFAGDIYVAGMLAVAIMNPDVYSAQPDKFHSKLVTVTDTGVQWKQPMQKLWEECKYSPAVAEVLAQALHPDPEKRPSAHEIYQVLSPRPKPAPVAKVWDYSALPSSLTDPMGEMLDMILEQYPRHHPALWIVASRLLKRWHVRAGEDDARKCCLPYTCVWFALQFSPIQHSVLLKFPPDVLETTRDMFMRAVHETCILMLEDPLLTTCFPQPFSTPSQLARALDNEVKQVGGGIDWRGQVRHTPGIARMWVETTDALVPPCATGTEEGLETLPQ